MRDVLQRGNTNHEELMRGLSSHPSLDLPVFPWQPRRLAKLRPFDQLEEFPRKLVPLPLKTKLIKPEEQDVVVPQIGTHHVWADRVRVRNELRQALPDYFSLHRMNYPSLDNNVIPLGATWQVVKRAAQLYCGAVEMAVLEDLTRNALPPQVVASIDAILPPASPPPSLLQLLGSKQARDWGSKWFYWYQQDCCARIAASHIVTQLLVRSAQHAEKYGALPLMMLPHLPPRWVDNPDELTETVLLIAHQRLAWINVRLEEFSYIGIKAVNSIRYQT